MKVTITGATGFIGRALCQELLKQGHEVVALTRDTLRAVSILGADVKCVVWGTRKDDWMREVAGSDVVIHLAGESVAGGRWTPEFKQKLIKSRVETIRELFEAFRVEAANPPVFLYASGIHYYGDGGDRTITEKSPRGSGFLAELSSVLDDEIAKANYLGMRTVAFRIGIVLGPNGGALQKMLYPLPIKISPWKLGLGGPLGSGKQWFPWIHLDDAVGLFLWAMKNPKVSGAVNAVAPQPIRNSEFSQALGRALHRPSFFPVPGFVLKAMIGGFADELLTGQKAVPEVAERLGYQFKYAYVAKALFAILKEQK